MLDNQYDTILDALKAARDKGFTNRFVLEGGMLRSLDTNESFRPANIRIEAFHRVEGSSDPDDNAILYLLETNTGARGTLTDAFGTYANSEISALIKKLEIDRSETIMPGASEKKCLNCAAVLRGKYCSECGQKDEHLHEPFWKLATHFAGDLFHFESKFVHTLVPLLVRPGFLTNEFNAGRRVRYMKPVPLYIFISIVFFFLFFVFNDPMKGLEEQLSSTSDRIDEVRDSVNASLAQRDSALKDNLGTVDSIVTISSFRSDSGFNISFTGEKLPATVEAYDDSVSKLPDSLKPGWITQYMSKREIEMKHRGSADVLKEFSEALIHNIPKLMFFLLPVFALILKLVYVRRKIYLFDHAIFTLHFHSFIFLFFTLLLLVSLFVTVPNLYLFAFLATLTYLLIAMRKVYRQSWGKTTVKLLTILFLYSFIGIFVMVGYVFVSLLMI